MIAALEGDVNRSIYVALLPDFFNRIGQKRSSVPNCWR
jgi:hypothetical protein